MAKAFTGLLNSKWFMYLIHILCLLEMLYKQ